MKDSRYQDPSWPTDGADDAQMLRSVWHFIHNTIKAGKSFAPDDLSAMRNLYAALERAREKLTTRSAARRRRRLIQQPRQLTIKQLEAVQIVGECQGNYAEAARRLGRDRATVEEHHKAAMKKLGREAVKHVTQALGADRRGQADVTADDDRRRG